MKTKSIVNVISFGKKSGEDALVDYMQSVSSAIDSIPQLTGKRLAFDLFVEDDSLVFKGGRYKLPEHRVTFISNGLPENENDFADWAEDFSALVLVCDAKELLDNQVILYEVARYRLAMNKLGRYEDALLLLCNVDEIVDIYQECDYENTQIGVSAAFTTVRYNSSRLVDKYQEKWNSMSNLYLLQSEIKLKTKLYGKIFALPPSLFCNFNNKTGSGYIELLQIFINLTIKHFNMKLFKTLDIKKCWSNLKRWCSKKFKGEVKTIRLVMVGKTATGKTYAMADLCQLLFEDYKQIAAPFYNQVADYLVRNQVVMQTQFDNFEVSTHLYKNLFKAKNGNKSFVLEFVDLPGDIFVGPSGILYFNAFRNIADTFLNNEGINYYVVKYKSKLRTVNILREDETTENERESEYSAKGFSKEENIQKVSLSSIFENMLDYDIKSISNVIMKNKADFGLKDDVPEDIVERAMPYLYFLFHATDIVICTKYGDDDTDTDVTIQNFVNIVNGLRERLGDKKIYRLIKAVDKEMKSEGLSEISAKFDGITYERFEKLNFIYSMFVYGLYNRSLQEVSKEEFFEEVGKVECMDDNTENFIYENRTEIINNLFKDEKSKENLMEYLRPRIGLDLPGHTYLTATPINIKYTIDEEEIINGQQRFGGDSRTSLGRLGFGVYQLLKDLLLRHEIESETSNYGRLISRSREERME